MKKKTIIDIVKHINKLNREEEIQKYGKPLKLTQIKKSKKTYSRKNKWSQES